MRPYADHVMEQFGAERVMFGSDWPVCLLAASYEEVMTTTRGPRHRQAWERRRAGRFRRQRRALLSSGASRGERLSRLPICRFRKERS